MAVERLNEGCLFWVYLGHGQRQNVDYVHVPQGYYPILDRACRRLAEMPHDPADCPAAGLLHRRN